MTQANNVAIESSQINSSGVLQIAGGGTNNGSLAVTAGGTLYTDGSKLVNVGAGTSGQVLTSAGASAPTWTTPSSGAVVQVKSTTITSITTSTTSSSFVDISGLSVSITPTSSSNKILVFVNVYLGNETATASVGLRLLRGSTAIDIGDANASNSRGFYNYRTLSDGQQPYGCFTGTTQYLDSPATTSATTYKVQWFCNAGTALYLNRPGIFPGSGATESTTTTSSITVMEVTP